MYDKNPFLDLRKTAQRISRRNFINFLPYSAKDFVNNSKYYLTPEREDIIMNTLYLSSKRVTISKEFENLHTLITFLKSFKQIPPNMNVFVWSTLTYGPVYTFNLKWLIDNFEFFFNIYNRLDIVAISENGKSGFMATKETKTDLDDPTNTNDIYRFKKWGLI